MAHLVADWGTSIGLILRPFTESHYQYAPPDNPHSVSYYTGCEFDCCFTEQDFLVDVVLDDIPSFTGPPSHSSSADHSAADVSTAAAVETGMWRTGRVRGDRGRKREDEGEYFSLTERCLHQQLSERLGHEAALLRQPSSLSASTLSDAFLSSVTATIIVFAVRLGWPTLSQPPTHLPTKPLFPSCKYLVYVRLFHRVQRISFILHLIHTDIHGALERKGEWEWETVLTSCSSTADPLFCCSLSTFCSLRRGGRKEKEEIQCA